MGGKKTNTRGVGGLLLHYGIVTCALQKAIAGEGKFGNSLREIDPEKISKREDRRERRKGPVESEARSCHRRTTAHPKGLKEHNSGDLVQ